jgi:hypothetical protein
MRMQIFHPNYTCIIYILNVQHLCAKHTNPLKKCFSHDFHYQIVWKLWDGKFVISITPSTTLNDM